MREATANEKESIREYIENISIETGVNFNDYLDKPIDKCCNCYRDIYTNDKHCVVLMFG